MDIAYVTDVVYPWKKGGAEKRIHEVAKRIAKEHEVTIYTMKWWDEPQKTIEKQNITYKAISSPKKLYKRDRRSIWEAIYFAINTLKIKNNHEIIDFNGFPYLPCFSGKIRTLFNSKMVVTWHEVWGNYWYKYLGKKGFFGKIIEKIVSKLPDKIIAVSQQTQRDLEKMGATSTLIQNGIDFEGIQEIEPDEEKLDVVFAGRLIPEKNLDVLIKALEDKETKLGVIGDGPVREKLEDLAKEYGVNARFFGEISYEKLIGYIKSASLFVSPSSREGFGITILEAMATGTPVITVDEENNAAKHLVSGERGLVVSLDKQELYKSIHHLLEKKEKRLGENARDFAKNFDWDKVTQKTLEAYRDLLE